MQQLKVNLRRHSRKARVEARP